MNIKDIKQFLSEEDAVSPVIGVILMVAITVILAAVIGTFVLGLGDQVQSSAPNANFEFSYSGDFDSNTGSVTITHNGGQDVQKSNIKLQIGTASLSGSNLNEWGDTLSTGSSQTIDEAASTGSGTVDQTAVGNGDTVRVIWTSSSGGSSNTIGQSTVPS